MPALIKTGEGGFAASTTADFGRYFGNAEVALRFLGRSVAGLICAGGGVPGSEGLDDCSSEEVR